MLRSSPILIWTFCAAVREQIITLAARDRVPAVYDRRPYATAGGLVSYGEDLSGAYRQIGVYAARILIASGLSPKADIRFRKSHFQLIFFKSHATRLQHALTSRVRSMA